MDICSLQNESWKPEWSNSCTLCWKYFPIRECKLPVSSLRESVTALSTLSPPRKHFLRGVVGRARTGRVAGFPCEEIATPQAADRVQRLFISLSLHCLREAKDKKGKETRKGKGPGTGSKSKESPLCSSTLLVLPVPAPPLLLPISPPPPHTPHVRWFANSFQSWVQKETSVWFL